MKLSKNIFIILLGSVAAGLVFLSSWYTGAQVVYSQNQDSDQNKGGSVFLPVVTHQHLRTVFGVQMPTITDQDGLQQVRDAEVSWVRRSNLDWRLIEQVEGQYQWNQPHVAQLEEELIQASLKGMEVILVVHQTPEWAQKIPGYACGPIKPDKIPSFAKFIMQAVLRYSKPPYNVKYWQIWNEPEADHAVVKPLSKLGCWGNPNDPFFGGGYFGDVLKEVYPKLKEANPDAKLVLGGLLLACHPENSNCPSPSVLFFEGVLNRDGAKDGGRYIDLVALHAYDNYYGKLGQYGNANWFSSWDDEGPAVISKAAYIRDVMNAYGIDLPLMVTEAALLCGRSGTESYCLTSEFEKTKAYYVAQLYGASIAEGFETTIWYHILGWRRSELLDDNLEPLLAYDAYKFAREEMRNGTFQRRIDDYERVVVYEINRSDRIVWLMWSQEGEKEIDLPGKPLAIWDVFGIPVDRDGLVVKQKPLYVEWPLP
jgi:hypothetical protein